LVGTDFSFKYFGNETLHLYSSENTVICCRYEHPIDTVKELADSSLPWVNIHEAWVWSLLDSDDPVSKTLVRHFQVLTEEEMTVLSTQGKTAFSLEKLASSKSTVVLTKWSNQLSWQSLQHCSKV
jgi:hypothetical protein